MSMRQMKIGPSVTKRDSQSLEKYLLEISRLKRIDPEEEAFLSEKIKMGCQQSLQQLVNANLRFVVSVAKQFQYHGLPLCDLVNEGNCGLVKAATRFDGTKGFKFISYAVWWIRQSILQALADHGRAVKVPLGKINLSNQVFKAHAKLHQELGREPSIPELAEQMGMKEVDITTSFYVNNRAYRMDLPVAEEEDIKLSDTLEDKDSIRADQVLEEQVSLQIEISRSLNTLTLRQKHILCAYFGIGQKGAKSLEEIGVDMGISRERVRQIKEKAIARLQHSHRSHLLREYLGSG
ncbi:MAG: sigma-70 family RNA polymerase sigma factor [Chitinophagaceae bacterium]|jgi:RNA polymerase primary sigma factor